MFEISLPVDWDGWGRDLFEVPAKIRNGESSFVYGFVGIDGLLFRKGFSSRLILATSVLDFFTTYSHDRFDFWRSIPRLHFSTFLVQSLQLVHLIGQGRC